MRNIQLYKGTEIDDDKISKLRQITKERYSQPIYDSTYWSIDNVEQLAFIYDINVEDIILVLGEDWFLCYTVSEDIVTILEWVALDIKDFKFIQTIEMMNVFRRVLLKYKDKQFNAGMRYDTSYQFYSKMLQKGYFKECSHTFSVDYCNGFAPEIVRNIYENYPCVGDFIDSNDAKNNPEYLTYVLHCLTFYVTDEFANKNAKLSRTL